MVKLLWNCSVSRFVTICDGSDYVTWRHAAAPLPGIAHHHCDPWRPNRLKWYSILILRTRTDHLSFFLTTTCYCSCVYTILQNISCIRNLDDLNHLSVPLAVFNDLNALSQGISRHFKTVYNLLEWLGSRQFKTCHLLETSCVPWSKSFQGNKVCLSQVLRLRLIILRSFKGFKLISSILSHFQVS